MPLRLRPDPIAPEVPRAADKADPDAVLSALSGRRVWGYEARKAIWREHHWTVTAAERAVDDLATRGAVTRDGDRVRVLSTLLPDKAP
jgi:hypothetical protein